VSELAAFADEVEKIAASVVMSELPGLFSVQGFGAAYMNPERVARATQLDPALAKHPAFSKAVKTKKHLVLVPPKRELRAMAEAVPTIKADPAAVDRLSEGLARGARRHELAHYKRTLRGKMEGYGKPGVRNVLRTLREEAIANISGVQGHKKMLPRERAIFAGEALKDVGRSTRHAYASEGGIRKALVGGTLGKLLRAARMVR